jgi:methionyl-tRNA formyltransferase
MFDTSSICFMGSPEYALPSLMGLHNWVGVRCVITRKDAAKGRSKKQIPTPIKSWSLAHNIPVFEPESKNDLQAVVEKLSPTLIIVIAYGMILPKKITETYPCINLHGSILPKYRGASPIQAALLNNDDETGVTAIRMNEKMDEGDILTIKTCRISPSDTGDTLFKKLSHVSFDVLKESLTSKINPYPQDHNNATYCKKLSTEDRYIKSTHTAEEKLGKIRAFSPRPGAFIKENGQVVKVLEATIIENVLTPIIVQPEGKSQMTYSDYLRGNRPPINL